MARVRVGDDLKSVLMAAYYSNIPVMLEGPTGIGKSETIEQVAKELKIAAISLDLSGMEAVDLVGLPVRDGDELAYLPPKLLPKTGKGILLLEELNRAPRHVRAPCYQLLTARAINTYRLPEKWLPMAAINPVDEYDVDELDPAMLSRFMHLKVVTDVNHWLRWAEANAIHPDVMEYVRVTPKVFDAPCSNPRAWKRVSDLLVMNSNADDRTLRHGVVGLVGDRIGHGFFKFHRRANRNAIPDAPALAQCYDKFRDQIIAWKQQGSTAVLAAVLRQVELFLQDPTSEKTARKSRRVIKNLKLLAGDLPPDLGDSLIKRLDRLCRKGVA